MSMEELKLNSGSNNEEAQKTIDQEEWKKMQIIKEKAIEVLEQMGKEYVKEAILADLLKYEVDDKVIERYNKFSFRLHYAETDDDVRLFIEDFFKKYDKK